MYQHDERDTVFTRISLMQGTKEYKEYYEKHPEKFQKDEDLRDKMMKSFKMPKNKKVMKANRLMKVLMKSKLLKKLRLTPKMSRNGMFGGKKHTAEEDKIYSYIPSSNLTFLMKLKELCYDNKANPNKVEVRPEKMSDAVKKLAKYFGADLVGITELSNSHYYSYSGDIKNGTYGQKIETRYKYAVVFAVEMEQDMINRAPNVEEIIATSQGYINAGIVGLRVAHYINDLGYEAENNMNGNYKVVLPLVAKDGGIGQIGRNGILVTKEYGPRVRLGAVLTNIPLIPDKEEDFGLVEFCEKCGKCSTNCPAKALPKGDRTNENGVLKWKIEDTKCFSMWMNVNTDCGICLSSCPFSQKVGVDLIDKMKDSPQIMKIIREEDNKFNGKRAFIKESLDLVKYTTNNK